MRQSWIEIDLDAVRSNVEALAKVAAPARFCAVVKADAYGHGDVPVAEAAVEAGADWLAVALVEEGARLREAGVEAPILLLSEPPLSDVDEVLRWRLTPTAYTQAFLAALEAVAGPEPLGVHVKLDTGMHRVGADGRTATHLARRAHAAPNLQLEGVWTHFAVADEDFEFTAQQLDVLRGFAALLREENIDPGMLHAANSAGTLFHPASRLDMVRVGIAMYGLTPAPQMEPIVRLRPAMRVVSQVALVRRLPAGARPSYGRRRALEQEAAVATVPVGYADGVVRRLSSVGGQVLIAGQRFPYAGTVTMDQVVIDVDDVQVEAGDEVVLLGRQGQNEITAEDWADWLGTINYEVVCNFGPRLPRRYRP